jgi:hypothetical protein
MQNDERFSAREKFLDASLMVLYTSDQPFAVILAELYLAVKRLNLNKLERVMSQVDIDVKSLAQQVQTNTATEQQLIAKLQAAIANADDPSTDTTVTSLLSQLQTNNTAMQNVLASVPGVPASGGDASGGTTTTTDPGTVTTDPGTGGTPAPVGGDPTAGAGASGSAPVSGDPGTGGAVAQGSGVETPS